ncbi:MAG: hypothetical protein IPL08_17435 [Saprospiraceae bacterium]|nr:hypothetical protein [Saprospiraceae bacterium]
MKILETEGFEFLSQQQIFIQYFLQNMLLLTKRHFSHPVNSNLFASPNTYYFELDSTASFDSPILKTNKIFRSNGGVISWNPTYNFIPNVVYYWRISPEAEANQEKYGAQVLLFIYLIHRVDGINHIIISLKIINMPTWKFLQQLENCHL